MTNVESWRKMKFGLMMHWGLYSVAGGVWQGKHIEGYNEQIKHRAKISWPDYLGLCSGFTAAKWDPDQIVLLAQEAGMRYVVITTKHHDGFNLWHTKLSDFNPVEATPAKKDVLKLLADACERHKLNFGLYYSLIDWHYPGALPMSDHNSDPITPALEEYTVGQLRELLTGYGPICEIWFDMSKPTLEQSLKFARTVHSLQPDCMISGRIWNGQDDFMECGDNETPDLHFEGAWESSVTLFHDTWGYRSWQERGNVEDKIREKIRDLAFVTAKGGNYLLNIGPRGDGSLVEFDQDVLRGIGRWMKTHGEAVYDSEPEPHLKLDFGYASGAPGKLYLYVATPPADGVLRVPGWLTQLPEATLLDGGRSRLSCSIQQGSLAIALPSASLDPYLTVVTVSYKGDQPYLPGKTLAIDLAQPTELPTASSLAWHRMTGNDYYSLRKYITGREWLVMPKRSGKWRLVARRPQGGAPAGYRLTIGAIPSQFVLSQSQAAQCYEGEPFELKAGELTKIKLQQVAVDCELDDKGLVLELTPVAASAQRPAG